jgi:phosphoribulokinase
LLKNVIGTARLEDLQFPYFVSALHRSLIHTHNNLLLLLQLQ